MRLKAAISSAATVLVAVAMLAPGASADAVISTIGSGAGQTFDPGGLAVDASTGTLYVADRRNNRINVFDADGDFTMSFGWGVATGASTFQTCTVTCGAGISGAGSGQFDTPDSLAFDSNSGSLYVFDSGNLRVQKFSSAGAFQLMFGGGVNKTTGADICTAVSGNLCGQGSQGSEHGEFGSSERPIGISSSGAIYVGDSLRTNELPAEYLNRIEVFEPSGSFQKTVSLPPAQTKPLVSMAVDSTNSFYLYFDGPNDLRKFSPLGEPLFALSIPEVSALGVDLADNLILAARTELLRDPSQRIWYMAEFGPTGNPLREFSYGLPEFDATGVAPFQSASGEVYVGEGWVGGLAGSRVLHISQPPPGPIVMPLPCGASPVGNTKATGRCEVNPEGKSTTVHFEYVDQEGYENGGFSSPDVEVSSESASIGSDFKMHEVNLPLEGLTPETVYHFRVVATNADGSQTGLESSFETKPPVELGDTWASDVSTTSAQLNGEVNPLGIPATGYFEYVDEATFQQSGFTNAETAPRVSNGEEPLQFGEGEEPAVRGAVLVSLKPGTSYRYRLSVENAFVSVKTAPRSFATFSEAVVALPDARGYELVSPAQKESAEAGFPGAAGGLRDSSYTTIQQAGADGEAFTFTSFTSFLDPKSAPGASQYLSRRSGGGWVTTNITPGGEGGNPLVPPVRGFTENLSLAGVAVNEPVLAPGAAEGFPNLYLQQNDTGGLTTLTAAVPEVSPLETDYCVGFGGVTSDGSRALILAKGALTPDAPAGAGSSLYEWSATGGLKLVSVLPGEVPAQPSAGTGFGARGSGCGTGRTIVRNALSTDGIRILFTYVPKSGSTRLLSRINGSETVQVDAKQGGPGTAGGGMFRAASTDGSKVLFIDQSRLVPGAGAGGSPEVGDLYLYDFDLPPGSRLSDLTIGPEAANVRGVLGASDDGSSVYYVATGVVTEDENSAGAKAVAGKNNLFVWRQGEGNRFIGTLAAADASDWVSVPLEQTARVSPDGGSVAFLSTESLTGYDNTVDGADGCFLNSEGELTGNPACAEVFLFDADSEELSCVSCNPAGARPIGPASLPAWASPFQQPRYLSDGGERLFFATRDAILPADTNSSSDVYEFERTGTGSCTAGSPAFSAAANGCLFLISSGTAESDAYLLDASTDGDDVFFSTRQRLVGQDRDERYDVYDARVGGGFAPPAPPAEECAGEACRPPAPLLASPPPPATIAPSDGNVKEKRKACPKGKHLVKKKGKKKCVRNGPKKKSKKGGKQRAANRGGGIKR